jgi:hypothetical protein
LPVEKNQARARVSGVCCPRSPHFKRVVVLAHVAAGKSSVAKILGNYAVRLGQKPVRDVFLFPVSLRL